MKSIARSVILGLSLSAAALMGAAHAAGAGQDVGEHLDYPVLQTASSKSRQQVMQELADARAKGRLEAGVMNDYPQISQGGTLSREQVAAEARQWHGRHDHFVAY